MKLRQTQSWNGREATCESVDNECVSRWGQLFGGVSTLMNCEERLRQRGSLSHMSTHSHRDTHDMWQTLLNQTSPNVLQTKTVTLQHHNTYWSRYIVFILLPLSSIVIQDYLVLLHCLEGGVQWCNYNR